jgi:hypothetical protein
LSVHCSGTVTSPSEHFGFAIGDDYRLATFTQTEAYFRKIAAESDRVRLVDIGPTEEGRRQPMLVVTSPANHARLARYRAISQRLARAEGLDEAEAQALANEGRAVVWIDGGLHANETVGTHQLIESAYRFASADDPLTLRILDDVIILLVHANPDGQELISSWYLRRPVPSERIFDLQPRLYQKYAGHDNNRDFFAMALRESSNLNRQLYVEWLPQIVYNHHQSAPPGTILSGPPYRDPFNYVLDPLLVTSIDAIGAAMNIRFNAEGKTGVTQRRGAPFSTWWNGGLRTTPYFHNQIGILTEVVGSPTPIDIPLLPERQIPSGDLPAPVAPQRWHYRQSIDYSLTANYAVLDYASRHRDQLLRNIYLMGRASIERGRRDHWTRYPSRVAAMRKSHLADRTNASTARTDTSERFSAYRAPGLPREYFSQLQKPEERDPRGYIIPPDQPDFPTAVAFVNMLIKAGVAVERSTAPFALGDKPYPAGSYIVKTAQAFRPHVLDMFEPQDHPDEFLHEGGPPIAPYDSAGWTPAFLMGVRFDRVLEAFDGPFVRIAWGEIQPTPPGRLSGDGRGGHLVSARPLNTTILVNRLLAADIPVQRLPQGVAGRTEFGPGTVFIPPHSQATPILQDAASSLGLFIEGTPAPPDGPRVTVGSRRIALWDVYGGSMPSGWARWLLERYEFPFDVVYPGQIDSGLLGERFDVLILPSGAVPLPRSLSGQPPSRSGYALRTPEPAEIPAEFRERLGAFSEHKTVPALRAFAESGGTIVAVGTSAQLAHHLGLPVRNALTELTTEGREQQLPREKFYVPGSVLSAATNPAHPLAWGLPETIDIYFDNNPVFRLTPEAIVAGVRPAVWFDSPSPLRSGWAWGQGHLNQGILAAELPLGRGRVHLIAPEATFRAQPYGTFKLLFNTLHGHAVIP